MAQDESDTVVRLQGVDKSFTMHLRAGAVLPVVRGVSVAVACGECVMLHGPSGIGKSSILKMIYGNYRVTSGYVGVRDAGGEWIDVARAQPRRILALRRSTVSYVSQFLRTIPRISALDLVTAAARVGGTSEEAARDRACDLLARLNLPERLWSLPPATFSGGEQQRVNIALGFAGHHPVLLLDEPTASLDATSRARVEELIVARRNGGGALICISHDAEVRQRLATRIVDLGQFSAAP